MFSVNLRNYDHLEDDPRNRFDESLFSNLGCATGTPAPCPTFWSGNRYPPNTYYPAVTDRAWVFDMGYGWQSGDYWYSRWYAWPVRDGDSKGAGGKKN